MIVTSILRSRILPVATESGLNQAMTRMVSPHINFLGLLGQPEPSRATAGPCITGNKSSTRHALPLDILA